MTYTDPLGDLAATGTTISYLPQAVKAIQAKNTKGVSLPMYVLFTIGTLFGLFTA